MEQDAIIGVDCATTPEKTGLALAVPAEDGWRLANARSGRGIDPAEQVAEWVHGAENPLLCLDAPLGWPVALSRALAGHRAGMALETTADRLFHRQCDDFIQARTGCRPMEVGANFIARTARSALALLGQVREITGRSLPLLWHREAGEAGGVIEVYPAATLRMHGLPWRRYKRVSEADQRRRIVEGWSEYLEPPPFESPEAERLVGQADVLDAANCVVAGLDFIRGEAMLPPRLDEDLAVEGWIWARRRAESSQ